MSSGHASGPNPVKSFELSGYKLQKKSLLPFCKCPTVKVSTTNLPFVLVVRLGGRSSF